MSFATTETFYARLKLLRQWQFGAKYYSTDHKERTEFHSSQFL